MASTGREERDRRDQRLNDLLERVAEGDAAAFGQLYDELASLVYGVARRVLGDRTMAEDVTQEVFVELWRHAARFTRQRSNVCGWAAMLARRRSIDRIRREESDRRRRGRHIALAAVPVDLPDDTVVGSEERAWARRRLEQLDPRHEHVLRLAFYDGLTHRQIAAHVGLPLGTVKTRIRAGLAGLRVAAAALPAATHGGRVSESS